MRVLIAPDSFKGTLSAKEVCNIIGKAFTDTIEDVQIEALPAADGGEGLCDCLQAVLGGEKISAEVSSVFGEKITVQYLMLSDKTAVIEMAVCAGLPLAGENKNPEKATTYGVGELICHAVKNGARAILLGLGGSATNDLGLGMGAALGWKFKNKKGESFIPTGETMKNIDKIIRSENKLEIPVTAACDVENPLYGENGAAFVFAPQKGADEAMVQRLDNALRFVADKIKEQLDIDISVLNGAGAAGGLGGGAVAFLGATLKKGIDILLDTADFDSKAEKADLIITGEGRLDSQSVNGKVISGIASRAKKLNKKVIAICGSRGNGAEEIKHIGVSELYFAVENETPFEKIKISCGEDLYNISRIAAENIKQSGG